MIQLTCLVDTDRMLKEAQLWLERIPHEPEMMLTIGIVGSALSNGETDILIDLTSKTYPELKPRIGVFKILDQADQTWGSAAFGLMASSNQQAISSFYLTFQATHSSEIITVDQGSATTELFFNKNKKRMRVKSLRLLVTRLRQWVQPNGNLKIPSGYTNDRDSNISHLIFPVFYTQMFIKTVLLLIALFFRHILLQKRYRWEVAIASGYPLSADLNQGIHIQNEPHCFLADPFVITEKGRTVVFAEELDYLNGRGKIVCYEIEKSENVQISTKRLGIALQEPFHLSFPYIFRYQDQLYMVPESSAANDLRIYACVEFPLQWKLIQTALKDVSAVDSVIFEKDRQWWLLTNLDTSGTMDHASELHLFYADQPLTDHWTPHKQNPVSHDATCARTGGFFEINDQPYRTSQIGAFFRYGAGTAIHKIEQISPNTYNETQLRTQLPDFFDHLQGHHHLASNGAFTVYDCCQLQRIKDR